MACAIVRWLLGVIINTDIRLRTVWGKFKPVLPVCCGQAAKYKQRLVPEAIILHLLAGIIKLQDNHLVSSITVYYFNGFPADCLVDNPPGRVAIAINAQNRFPPR